MPPTTADVITDLPMNSVTVVTKSSTIGTMLALWLLENNPNMTADEAIQFVRAHRPNSIKPGTQ